MRLEQQMRSRQGPTWLEMVQAEQRLGALALKKLNSLVFGTPDLSVADQQREEQDEALVREWRRRRGYAPAPLPPDVDDRLIQRIEERIEAGEGPWPDT